VLWFAGNGAVAAAIVQWVLRESDPRTWNSFALHVAALAAAAVHAFGAWRAIDMPGIWMGQRYKDEGEGIENPLTAAPHRAMKVASRCFIAGVAILGVSLLREALTLPRAISLKTANPT